MVREHRIRGVNSRSLRKEFQAVYLVEFQAVYLVEFQAVYLVEFQAVYLAEFQAVYLAEFQAVCPVEFQVVFRVVCLEVSLVGILKESEWTQLAGVPNLRVRLISNSN